MQRETKIVRTLLMVPVVIVLLVSVAGCGIVSDQTKQEAKKKVETGQKNLENKVDDLKEKVETSQEELGKKADDLKKEVETGRKDVKNRLDDVQRRM